MSVEANVHNLLLDLAIDVIWVVLDDLHHVGTVLDVRVETGQLALPASLARKLGAGETQAGVQQGGRCVVVAEVFVGLHHMLQNRGWCEVLPQEVEPVGQAPIGDKGLVILKIQKTQIRISLF